MYDYKILKITKPMKECSTISCAERFEDSESIYNWLTNDYIERQVVKGYAYTGGLYAVIALDSNGNYKNAELVLDVLEEKIIGYRMPTSADELRITRFLGIE